MPAILNGSDVALWEGMGTLIGTSGGCDRGSPGSSSQQATTLAGVVAARALSGLRGLGVRDVYTPQVVINGSVHALGSDKAAIERAIAQTHHDPAILSVPVKVSLADEQIQVALPDRPPLVFGLGGQQLDLLEV